MKGIQYDSMTVRQKELEQRNRTIVIVSPR